MLNCIARILAPLLRLLWPASGGHRSPGVHPAGPHVGRPAPRLPHTSVLRGEDTALVRPYLVAHERGQEARQQRARRRALWLAVHGVDIGPQFIHGVEVTA